MIIKITKGRQGSNKGSCTQLVNYLEKENLEKDTSDKRHFFSHELDKVSNIDVEHQIDSNHAKLNKKESKYFMVIISPSEKELIHIGSEESKLIEYTRSLMDEYADNFRKGHLGKDLVWFAKIEEFRKNEKEKVNKEGPQWHIHVIVSRMDKAKKCSLSLLTNHRNTTNGAVLGGFDRNTFREKSEQIFDYLFEYSRDFTETFECQNGLKNGARSDENVKIGGYRKREMRNQELINRKLIKNKEVEEREDVSKKQGKNPLDHKPIKSDVPHQELKIKIRR